MRKYGGDLPHFKQSCNSLDTLVQSILKKWYNQRQILEALPTQKIFKICEKAYRWCIYITGAIEVFKNEGGDKMLPLILTMLESDEDRQRFIKIYEQYHALMEQTAMRILAEQSDAEDAVQNAFVQMIRHVEKIYEIPCENLPFWIISIVKNESLIILRRKKRTVPLEDWDNFAAEAEDVTGYQELVGLFARLPESYRAVLEMKILSGYADREVAEKLGISRAAVSTRANRGRALLRRIAEKEGFHV